VSGFIAQHQGWIVEASYHTDQETQRFFMRQEILTDSLPFGLAEFHARFSELAQQFDMEWRINNSAQKKRLVILGSLSERFALSLA